MTEEKSALTQLSSPESKADCPRCRRALLALQETRKGLREAMQQNLALKEELLAAGEMIDDLAAELDKRD